MRVTSLLVVLLPVLVTAAACDSSTSGSSSGSALDQTPNGPVDPNAAAKAAALLGSCIPDDRSNRILRRIYERTGTEIYDAFERAAVACLATKTNGCQGVTECTGVGVDRSTDCKNGCDGTVATSCDDGARYRLDCAKLGLQCVVRPGSERADCQEAPLAACDVSSHAASCEDGRPTFCTGAGLRKGPRCADLGTECRDATPDLPAESKTFACVGTAGTCKPESISPGGVEYGQGLSCNGATLRACVNGGVKDVDCSTLGVGFSCQSTGSAFFCGLANECAPGSGTRPSCEGNTLVLCNAGRVERIDCTSLGFTGCLASAGACVPSVWGD